MKVMTWVAEGETGADLTSGTFVAMSLFLGGGVASSTARCVIVFSSICRTSGKGSRRGSNRLSHVAMVFNSQLLTIKLAAKKEEK